MGPKGRWASHLWLLLMRKYQMMTESPTSHQCLGEKSMDSAVTEFNYMTVSLAWPWEGVITRPYLLLRKKEAWPWTGSTTCPQLCSWQMAESEWFQWFSCRCRRWLFLFVCNYITSFFLIKLGCIWVPKPQLKVILCFPWNSNEHRCDWNYQGLSRVAKWLTSHLHLQMAEEVLWDWVQWSHRCKIRQLPHAHPKHHLLPKKACRSQQM